MKQTITLFMVAFFCLVFSANAQINKGSIMLGGTINGYSTNLKSLDSSITKSNGFTVAPALGFSVSTNTILGFSLSYSSSTNKYDNASINRKDHTYGAGVFLRKYNLLTKNLYLFGEGNLMYYHTSYNYSIRYVGPEYDSKANAVSLNVTPGIAYNLTRSIQLESGLQNLLSVSYVTRKETPKEFASGIEYKENSFNMGTSLNPVSFSNIFVGIRFLFNK